MENRVGNNYSKQLSDPHPVQVGSTAASSDLFRAIHHAFRENRPGQIECSVYSTCWRLALHFADHILRPETVRVAVGLRLGANICEPHTCACGVPVTAKGEHGLSCQLGFGRVACHGAVNDLIYRALSKDFMLGSRYCIV